MAIIKSFGTSDSNILKVESTYGIVLPEDYFEFLTRFNGMFIGSGSYCTIPFLMVDNGEVDFQEMYGIDTKNETLNLIKANEIRDEFVAFDNPFVIGADPGGNLFLINGGGSDKSIYYWDRNHIHFDDGFCHQELSEEGNVYKIFNTFTAFYNSILYNVGGDVRVNIELL